MGLKYWFRRKLWAYLTKDYILVRRTSKCMECSGRKIRTQIPYTCNMRAGGENPRWYPIHVAEHWCYKCENCGEISFATEDCDAAYVALQNVLKYVRGEVTPLDAYPVEDFYKPNRYQRFHAGQKVVCCKDVDFKFGGFHKKGEIYIIKADELDYYNACDYKDYQVVHDD
jgi:hypothetical protein